MADAQRPQQPPEALADELAQLRATLAAQQQELTAQRALIAQQQAAIAALRSESASADATDLSEVEAPALPRKTSRRKLLVGAAGVAAAATAVAAATVALNEPQVAQAASGGNLILGASNDADAPTSLTNTTGTAPSPVLEVDATTPGIPSYAIYATSFSGVYGGATPNKTPKSRKKASLEGAPIGAVIAGFGGADAGNAATAAGKAMPGSGSGGVGQGTAIVAVSDYGFGVEAASYNSIDLVMDGSGRMYQVPQFTSGAPTGGSFQMGESIRDDNGDLWLCLAGGSPGTWAKVAHLAPGATSGGAITYLSKPIRLFDSRVGASDGYANPGTPCRANTSTTVQVAGITFHTVTVPTGIAGAIGNVTSINGKGVGFIEVVPGGAGFTGAANLAFAPGQVVSNAYNVGLNSGGALDIYVGDADTDVIVDLFAVVS